MIRNNFSVGLTGVKNNTLATGKPAKILAFCIGIGLITIAAGSYLLEFKGGKVRFKR